MHPPDTTTIGLWLIGAAALAGAVLALWRVAVALTRAVRRFGHFLDDWFGEPARRGVPARPGFPERMSTFEEHVREVKKDHAKLRSEVADTNHRVDQIVNELYPNGGRSLRDVVDRVEQYITRGEER